MKPGFRLEAAAQTVAVPGPGPEALAQRVRKTAERAKPPPADAERAPPLRRKGLGGNDIFAAINAGADDVVDAQSQRRAMVALVQKAVLQRKAAVVAMRHDAVSGLRAHLVKQRIAERGREPVGDLERQRVSGLVAEMADRKGEFGILAAKRGGHVDQPRHAETVHAPAAPIVLRRSRRAKADRRKGGEARPSPELTMLPHPVLALLRGDAAAGPGPSGNVRGRGRSVNQKQSAPHAEREKRRSPGQSRSVR